MKQPLLFKGDSEYVYASGVVRGLEPYILTRGDYQKVLDAEVDQLAVVLSELGYGGGEIESEHALNSATDRFFNQLTRLSKHREFTDTLKLHHDFRKASVILKTRFLEHELPELVPWGTMSSDELRKGIEALLDGEKTELPRPLVEGVELAKKSFAAYNSAIAVDIALDRVFAEHLNNVLPEGEYFLRWMAVYADWLNVKAMVRILAAKLQHKMFWELFAPGGDIPEKRFREALEGDAEHISAVFMFTEYGKKLAGAVKLAMDDKPAALDILFRGQLISLYRYTRYCPYGLELLWAYALTLLEEIGALRTILRAKKAGIPADAVKEVISVVVE